MRQRWRQQPHRLQGWHAAGPRLTPVRDAVTGAGGVKRGTKVPSQEPAEMQSQPASQSAGEASQKSFGELQISVTSGKP